MEFFDKQEILDKCDCKLVAEQLLHLKMTDGRTVAFWRNGTNPKSVSFAKEGYFDHGCKSGGSAIDLVMKVRGCNFVDAIEELGTFCGCNRSLSIKAGKKKVAEYVYTNEKGEPVHKSVRYNLADGEKEFCQYRWDGKDWQLGLGECVTLPYNLPNIINEQVIHLCYSDDTEILTSKGWVLFKELKGSEKVASYDMNGEQVQWETPSRITQYDYIGTMYNLQNDWCDILVSPNHRFLTQRQKCNAKIRTAEELCNQLAYPVAGFYSSAGVGDVFDIDSISEWKARFISCIVADGHFEKHNTKIVFNFKKQRKKERIRMLCSNLGIDVAENIYPSCPEWTEFRVALKDVEWINKYLNKKKYLPACLELSTENRIQLIDELQYWDGDKSAKNSIRFFTSEKDNADFISMICVISGHGCNIRSGNRHRTVNSNTEYICNIVPKSWRTAVKKPSAQQYNGKIYCCTVSTGFIIVRRNGKTMVSGNSEGEKACEATIKAGIKGATTLPMGAGKWFEHWGKWFKDKDVIIVRDNDDAGYAHGARLAWELKTVAKSIKLITPSKITKGDCYEYFNEEGGTKDSFLQLTNATPALDIREIHEPKEAKEDKQEIDAKTLNKTAFKNYTVEDTGKVGKNGKTEKLYHARGMKELISEIRTRLLGFPKKCGGKLFDVDKKTQKHMEINDAVDICAWINLKTGHTPIFRETIGFVTAKTFFQALYRESEEFELISDMPHHPPLENVYYLKKDMPEPTKEHYYFNEFCKFFHGETYEDALLIKICVASLFYYEYKADKPMWIIDVAPGASQGVGKTKLVEMMAYLLNSEPFWISPNLFKVNDITTQLNRRLLSMDGRRKRVFVIDNVETFFKSPELASYITQGSFSGMAPYGKGETSRINDLNFFITSNKGSFDTDIIIRSFIIHLNYNKNRNDNWITDIKNFIKAHRFQIASEVMDILQNEKFKCKPQTRFKTWEQAVLMPIVGNQADFDAVIAVIRDRGVKSDGEIERAEILNDFIYNKIRDLDFYHSKTNKHIDPDNDFIFCESYVLMKWAQEAIPNMGGGKQGGNIMHLLRQMANSNPKFILSSGIEKFPIGKSMTGQKRGMMWKGNDFLLKLTGVTSEEKKNMIKDAWVLSISTEKTQDNKSYQTVKAKTWGEILREIEDKKARSEIKE